jgi:hypothetical protein
MEANWKPLETRLGDARCAGFMFMGNSNGVNQYKHGLSRRYLFLDDEGRAYEAAGRNEFREIPFDKALARVEEPLKELGETLETAYDDAYVNRKEAALRAAGIEVLRIRIVSEDRVVVRRQNSVMPWNQELEIPRDCVGKPMLRRVTREKSCPNSSSPCSR